MLQVLNDARAADRVSTTVLRAAADELRDLMGLELRLDAGSRALYATDASNYRQVPLGVVVPRNEDDVVATLAVCRRHQLPVLSRGAGTSLCGQCCNAAVVIDFSQHLNRILEIDTERRIARVQPGVVLDDLRHEAQKHGLTFAPDPATHTHNTLGGMLGNNSCGPHSVMGGKTQENVLELDVLTYEGTRLTVGEVDAPRFEEIQRAGGAAARIHEQLRDIGERYADEIRARYPDIPRRVSGYNLEALLPGQPLRVAQALVGSEGTCVVVLQASLRLVPHPPHQVLLVLGYPDIAAAGDHVATVMQQEPIALEGMDNRLVQDMRESGLDGGTGDGNDPTTLLPEGKGWLLAEFGGDSAQQAEARARDAMQTLAASQAAPTMKLHTGQAEQQRAWRIRESGLGATAHVPGRALTWEGWEDAAVPPERLGEYLRRFRALLDEHGYRGDLYGHFGQGCVHTRINFDLVSAEGIARYRRFLHAAAELVVDMGGSISGEHGDGQSKGELLHLMYGERLMEAMHEFKAAWDPQWRMNPGKVIHPYRADQNLRLGTGHDMPVHNTHFRYPEDGGDFGHALLRCVGVGKCRKSDGVMCPSFMATGEEKHTTRGRAHLLFEMARGEVITDGWHSEAVKEALDLCLSCKGCKGECPVKVDMATHKAEFLSHYYEEGHWRPMAAHAFGRIDRWARWAALAPTLVNGLSQREPFAALIKRAAGIAPARRLPVFATQTFQARHRNSRSAPSHARSQDQRGERVLLWADTFNNHLHPPVLEAAVRVLEHLGCEVVVPQQPLCCGRPLLEFGWVAQARARLQQILQALDPDIRAGTPVIGLEPACVSMFKDDMHGLLPYDDQARRLRAQVVMLGDFVAQRLHREGTPAWPRLARRALVHAHCHHSAVLGLHDELAVLDHLGLDHQLLDTGCCGMAGSFGFERDKYQVSMRCAERTLLPAMRGVAADTLLIANGYSCREQVAQGGVRRPLHLAEVLALALEPIDPAQ